MDIGEPGGATVEATSRNRPGIVAIVGVMLLLGAVAAGAFLLFRSANTAPSFVSLADSPDPSLHGTVAYLDSNYGPCLRVVAVSGTPSKELECLGKDAVNAELVWLPDGRLLVTVPGEGAGAEISQRIYDAVVGEVTAVPAADIDLENMTWSPRAVNNNGERLTATSAGGHGTVVVTGASGSRTVFDEKGGSQYSIGEEPSWSPDDAFILLTDSSARLLVVTPDGGKARVLADELGNNWAITDRDLLEVGD